MAPAPRPPRYGVARVLSKRGICSRTQAAILVRDGRVRVDGRRVDDPEWPVDARSARIEIDGLRADAAAPVWIALNKPRGVVTSARDERGRDTVYRCIEGSGLPWLAPVGRLDKASEGLLLLCNDPVAAAALTGPASGVPKTYRVQVAPVPDAAVLDTLRRGIVHEGDMLEARSVEVLRSGGRTAWLEFVLVAGRNRHIRRMLSAVGLETRRLVRVAIGELALGALPKGAWRRLEPQELARMMPVRGER